MSKPFLIGLAGPSGAGKTTLAKHLHEQFPHITHIRLDGFYKNFSDFPQYKQWVNREAPENLHWDEIYDAIKNLAAGADVTVPLYDRPNGVRSGFEKISPTEIILVEGFLLFFDPRIRDFFDMRVFLHVSLETQYARKKSRWPEMDDNYFHEVVVPMFEIHGREGMRHAHLTLNGENEEAVVVQEFHNNLVGLLSQTRANESHEQWVRN